MRAPVLRFELVEAHVLRPRRGHEPHGHGHESEADRSGPDGTGHGGLPVLVAYYLRRSWHLRPTRVRDGPRSTTPSPTSRSRAGACALTNLDKVLYPATGFTKGQVVDYYARIAPAMLPHLARPADHDGPAARRRRPASGSSRSAARATGPPGSTPCRSTPTPTSPPARSTSVPALVWTANLAALELHTHQARAAEPWTADRHRVRPRPRPRHRSRRLRARRARAARPPRPARAAGGGEDVGRRRACTSRSAIRPSVDADDDQGLRAGARARCCESRDPKRVTVDHGEGPARRAASSSTGARTTATRRRCARTRSAPPTSRGVDAGRLGRGARARGAGDVGAFAFTPADVLERVDELGDLYADSLTGDQDLPQLG